MSRFLEEQFDQHAAWRGDMVRRLKWLAGWLRDNDLLDQAVAGRLRVLGAQLRTSKVMVAFVAEYSRGKSELINAIFFAAYGRRIMPASAGRTTMCPTELSYDPAIRPRLSLLPIETRLESHALAYWRELPQCWIEIAIDVHDVEALAEAMQKVAEVHRVPMDEARALGFWSDDAGADNPLPDAQGQIEIPRWRHALLNMPHPLLERGLVILDTPGLNAIGAEPELTIGLIPQAHAVLFILGVDTGVTRSDMAIWREHLVGEGDDHQDTRIIVLNKIDTLWDILSTPEQVEAQIERQCAESAQVLGVSRDQMLPVSAQKGLQAKIQGDTSLLKASRLPALEAMLGTDLLIKRERMLRLAVESSIGALRMDAERVLQMRERDLSEQSLELQGLRGKNANVMQHMRARIEHEQTEFESSNSRISALRTVQSKLLREVYAILGDHAVKVDMGRLSAALKRPGVKLTVRGIYSRTFDALRDNLREVQATAIEIQAMLSATFRQLNAEHGFALLAPAEPDLIPFAQQFDQIQQAHLQYLGIGNLLRLTQPQFCDKLVLALMRQVQAINEAAMAEVERWCKAASAQLDVQIKERRRHYGKRIESVERIQQAAGSLDERLAEIETQKIRLMEIGDRLHDLTASLLPSDHPQSLTPSELRVA